MQEEKIQIIGLGYIGLPSAAILAQAGFEVFGVDVSQKAVDAVNAGTIHIHEDGLEEVVLQAVTDGLLRAGSTPEVADVHIIAVPTPVNPDKTPGLDYVRNATKSIAAVLKRGDLVILESTVPPRTCIDVIAPILQELTGLSHETDYDLAHCPERVIPGKILHELVHNDRIIGGTTQRATERTVELYGKFVKGDLLKTDSKTAEMCKLMENTFRDVNIALANEFSVICEKLDIDVFEAIQFANHHPRVNIHQPGIGVGGHCIPVDPWFIIDAAKDESNILKMARQTNDSRPHFVARRILDHAKTKGGDIILLGLSYKPDVDDFRESPAVEVAVEIARNYQGDILIVEPFSQSLPKELLGFGNVRMVDFSAFSGNHDVVVILTHHTIFKSVELGPVLSMKNNFKLEVPKF